MTEKFKLVPVEPTEAQWGALARDIMTWLGFSRPTPRTLLDHLRRCGHEPPAWLRDEPEMEALDHVMSKGTRCVLIYRAMLAAAPDAPATELVAFEMDWPDYHPEAMGCGLEDQNISNRYEAMRYGWYEAIERCAECLPEELYTHAPDASAQEEDIQAFPQETMK